MVRSMTAYAHREAKQPWGSLDIELRSVNHRFLEMNTRLPEELRPLEMKLRNQIKEKIKRGKLDLTIKLQIQGSDEDRIRFNRELAAQVATTLHEIDKLIYNAAPVNAIDILNWPGVQESRGVEQDALEQAVFPVLDNVMADLLESKEREGEALKTMVLQRCSQMREVVSTVREHMPEILQVQRNRLKERLEELTEAMDNDRLEQEMVFIAQKADVDEELDRLETHLTEIERVLESDELMGRRLDFLMQELNREANTLGSKSISNITTQASVDMKVLTEQMREQIQNIE